MTDLAATLVAPAARAPGFWRRFLPVWGLGLLGVAGLALQAPPPGLLEAAPELAALPPLAVRAVLLVNPLLLVTLYALLGAALAHRVGLGSAVAGTAPALSMATLARVAGLGLLLGVVLAAVDLGLAPHLGEDWRQRMAQPEPAWPGLPAALLYGGLAEEVMLRWGLMAALAWLLARAVALVERRPAGPAGPVVMAVAIAVSSLAFAAAHLPVLAAVVEPTPAVVLRTLALNGGAGLLYGWLFWRHGLEAAMAAHAATHVGLFAARGLIA